MAHNKIRVLVDAQTVTATTNYTYLLAEDNWIDPIFFLDATHNSGTTPTLDVTVQHSPDGTNWFTYDTFTQVTTSDNTEVIQPAITSVIRNVLGYVRIRAVLGGSSPNYTFTAKMCFRSEGDT